MNGRTSVVEALERRALLSTTSIGELSPNWGDWSVEGSGQALIFLTDEEDVVRGDTATVTVTLPAHTMLRWSATGADIQGSDPSVNGAEIDVTVAGETRTAGFVDYVFDTTGNVWRTHSSSSVTITVSAQGAPVDSGINVTMTLWVYQPTVSLAGSGTVVEDGTGAATFTVSRDLPTDWSATGGHDPVPATTVSLVNAGGTATSGVDYQALPTSLTIPVNATGSTPYSVVPINDPDAEDIETIFASVGQPANGAIYVLAAPPATAPATNPTTQKVDLEDDVSVTSITVKVLSDVEGDALLNAGKIPEYYSASVSGRSWAFSVLIEITGESLHKVEIRQNVAQLTQVWDYDGSEMNDAEQKAAIAMDAETERLWNTGGYVLDTDWDWETLSPLANSNNGTALQIDHQRSQLSSAEVNAIDNVPVPTSRIFRKYRAFNLLTRNKDDHTAYVTKHWEYAWDNTALLWNNGHSHGPPANDAYRAYLAAGVGNFFGDSGIDAFSILEAIDQD